MISVLLPTRKRPTMLMDSVNSLYDLAHRTDDIDLILRVDDDDSTPYSFDLYDVARFIRGPRYGYKGIHLYYEELARAAKHPWCLIWNDDMQMATPGWDDLLIYGTHKFSCQFLWDSDRPGVTTCPYFPKRWLDIVGNLSLNAHVDSWLDLVSDGAGCRVKRDDVVFRHHGADDETARERVIDPDGFHTPANYAARAADIAKIRAYLDANPEMRP